ncbi:MAG TPA: ATP-binding protein, partial [Verrucomicrobiae bacterium]
HNLFLTFEESLNNVLKHSGATKVVVEMTVNRRQFEIKVSDNGHGFPAQQPHPDPSRRAGNGLKNMEQRLRDIGGECQITSQPGAGTTVTFRIMLGQPGHPFS